MTRRVFRCVGILRDGLLGGWIDGKVDRYICRCVGIWLAGWLT